jgi:hypothetical protein
VVPTSGGLPIWWSTTPGGPHLWWSLSTLLLVCPSFGGGALDKERRIVVCRIEDRKYIQRITDSWKKKKASKYEKNAKKKKSYKE